MRLITDTEWARMSWHARQRYIAHLARLRRELHAELETTQGALAAVTIIEAKRMLRRAAVSSDGAARIEAALLEVYGPAKRRKGRPLTEVDAVIVQRLKDGEAVDSTPAERAKAVTELTRDGLTVDEIAERVGVTRRTVNRIRARVAA